MTKKKEQKRYSKDRILNSNRYTLIQKDLLRSLLDLDKKYSLEEVKKLIQDFSKKEAK